MVDIVATTTIHSHHRAHSHVVVAQRQQPGVSSLSYLVGRRAIPLKSSGKLSAEKVMNSCIRCIQGRLKFADRLISSGTFVDLF